MEICRRITGLEKHGGFAGPAPSEDLFVRRVQNGIFQPRFSIHSASDDNTVTEPWMFRDSAPLIRDAILLRYHSPLRVAVGDGDLEHFLSRRRFDAASAGWYYSQSKRAVLVKYPNPKRDTVLTVSFEDFDLIGM